MKRSPIRKMSKKRVAANRRRRKVLHAAYGDTPRCVLCEPLQAAGIDTGCDGRAVDGDEIRRRSALGSIEDLDNVRPVGRACHDWVGANPARAHELGLTVKSWETP